MPEPIQVPVRYEARAYYTSDLDQWEALQDEEGTPVSGRDFDTVLEEARSIWEEYQYHGVLAIVEIRESIQVIV